MQVANISNNVCNSVADASSKAIKAIGYGITNTSSSVSEGLKKVMDVAKDALSALGAYLSKGYNFAKGHLVTTFETAKNFVTTHPTEVKVGVAAAAAGAVFTAIVMKVFGGSDEKPLAQAAANAPDQAPAAVNAPVAQAPVAQAPVAQAPVAQAPVADAPVAEANA